MLNDPAAFEQFFTRFFQGTLTGDEVGLIVRSHLYYEYVLGVALERRLPSPHFSKPKDMAYEQRLRLCRSLDMLDDECYGFLKALGALRNKFSHQLDRELEEADFVALQAPLTGKAGQSIQDMPGDEWPVRDRVCGLLITLVIYVTLVLLPADLVAEGLVGFHQRLREMYALEFGNEALAGPSMAAGGTATPPPSH